MVTVRPSSLRGLDPHGETPRKVSSWVAVRCAPCPTTCSLPRSRSDCKDAAPLAARLRPRSLDDVVGQAAPARSGQAAPRAHRGRPALVGDPLGAARNRQDHDRAPGRGRHREGVRAVVGGDRRCEGRAGGRRAGPRARMGEQGRGTILFLDEVHRFNRTQQDALLPHVEEGLLVLIGATTENPFFSLTGPLLSRSTLFRLDPLSHDDLTHVAVARARRRRPRSRRPAPHDRRRRARSSRRPVRRRRASRAHVARGRGGARVGRRPRHDQAR